MGWRGVEGKMGVVNSSIVKPLKTVHPTHPNLKETTGISRGIHLHIPTRAGFKKNVVLIKRRLAGEGGGGASHKATFHRDFHWDHVYIKNTRKGDNPCWVAGQNCMLTRNAAG